MVFEMQGGMSKEAAGVLHGIAAAVANIEASDPAKVKEELLQRLSLTIARASGGRVSRRLANLRDKTDTAARRALMEARFLQDE